MSRDDRRRRDVLALTSVATGLRELSRSLDEHGYRLEVTGDLQELRSAFFRCGGHELVLLTGELSPRLALIAAYSLHELDRELPIVVFGEQLARLDLPQSVRRIQRYHPDSRAGIGALLRVLACDGR